MQLYYQTNMITRLGCLPNCSYKSIPDRFLSFDHQWCLPWNEPLAYILGPKKGCRDRQSGFECPRSTGCSHLILEADQGTCLFPVPFPSNPLQAFGWRTFKRMGASIQIRTQYRAVLILSITIQLAFFFIVASAGLWLDQLINGVISQMTIRKAGLEVLTVMVLIVSP
jgi:hypothetical protein